MPRADMILDTNVFIESKNRYYAMDICPGFWEFLEDDFKAGRSMSITHVRAEILDVCDHFHIRHVNVYEYLRAQRALFYFRKKI